MSSDEEDRTLRRIVAAIVGLTLVACLVSYAVGAAPGRMLGYELFTRKTGDIIWLVIAVMVAVTVWPLYTFVRRGEVEIWDRSAFGLRRIDRDEEPLAFWGAIWGGVVLFIVIFGGLFLVRIAR